MAIISVLKCSKTRVLYSLLREHCASTLLLSIIEHNCVRPANDMGIGFPVMTSVSDVIPMLVDMRHDFMSEWKQINIIHDTKLGNK